MTTPINESADPLSCVQKFRKSAIDCCCAFFNPRAATNQRIQSMGYQPPPETKSSSSSFSEYGPEQLTAIKDAFLFKYSLEEIDFNANKKSLVCTLSVKGSNTIVLLKYSMMVESSTVLNRKDPVERERENLTRLQAAHEKDNLSGDRHFPALIELPDGVVPRMVGTREPIVMEFIAGQTLLKYLNTNTVDLSKCFRLIKQIIIAIRQIHQYGIMHRDLNASNLIVTDADRRIVIIDFETAGVKSPVRRQRSVSAHTIGITPRLACTTNGNPQPASSTSDDIFALCSNITFLLQACFPVSSFNPRWLGDPEYRDQINKKIHNESKKFIPEHDLQNRGLLKEVFAFIEETSRECETFGDVDTNAKLTDLEAILTGKGAFTSLPILPGSPSITGASK